MTDTIITNLTGSFRSSSEGARFRACRVTPGRVGVRCYPGQMNAARRELDEEQDVQRLQPDGLHREEVRGKDPVRLGPEELSPRRARSSRRRAELLHPEHSPDGGCAHPDAHLAQLAPDANVAPAGVLPGQAQDDFGSGGRLEYGRTPFSFGRSTSAAQALGASEGASAA